MNETGSPIEASRIVSTPCEAEVRVRGLVKHYEGGRVRALDGLDLDVRAGEFVAICGPSGCGKSTLLNMLSAIDRPDAGEVIVCGQHLSKLKESEANLFRATRVGLVFQLHNLLPSLSALENVQVPMMPLPRANGALLTDPSSRAERARELLSRVGLDERMSALPTVLSGGERQRVAIARALSNRPRVLLADEPTGALDSKTGQQLFDLLEELQRELSMTLVVVTHDTQVASRAERIIHIIDGRVVDEG